MDSPFYFYSHAGLELRPSCPVQPRKCTEGRGLPSENFNYCRIGEPDPRATQRRTIACSGTETAGAVRHAAYIAPHENLESKRGKTCRRFRIGLGIALGIFTIHFLGFATTGGLGKVLQWAECIFVITYVTGRKCTPSYHA